MFTALDLGTLILIACLVTVWHALPLVPTHKGQWALLALAMLSLVAVRVAAGDGSAIDLCAAWLLAYTGAALGRRVIIQREWPTAWFVVALALVTATGAYLRAYRLNDVVLADRALQPDVVYYHEHALQTANPFAAGFKSPLWPALHSPLLHLIPDANISMRLLSWVAGVAMLALSGWALGRLLHPLVGLLTAGTLAVEPWLIDQCCDGLREEAGVCLWMIVLLLLFAPLPAKKRVGWTIPRSDNCPGFRLPERVWWAALAGGVLLLLRNISLVPLLALTVWAVWLQRWRGWRAAVALVGPLLIVSPFYVNQYRAYGDPFAMEKRDARYHANLEFASTPPSGLAMPTTQEHHDNLFAGPPLSPLAYLLRYHSLTSFARNQWSGLQRVLTGAPFDSMFGLWWRLACTVGVLASFVVPRARFMGLLVLMSTVGITAHLLAIGQLELRLLLPQMVVWIAAGVWLVVSVGDVGIRRAVPEQDSRSTR